MQKTDLYRFKTQQDKLWGIYRGVVEDRKDPLRLGRVRVRIMGVHTEEMAGDLNKVPWKELTWAEPIGPNFEGSISGSGSFCVPLQGSHVMVFFENGNIMQPRYFGTVPGFPVDGGKYSQLAKQDGYRDPNKIYPLTDHLKEHDWQRLARQDKLAETYLQLKKLNLDKGVPIAFDGTAWDEQPPMFEAEYPDNNVFATHDDYKTNIVIELDSTMGKERFSLWHPSKSYLEINHEGRMVLRNKFHRWDICDEMVHMHYKSYHFKTIDDTMVFLLKKDEFREIKKKRWTKIHSTDWRNVKSDSHEIIESSEFVKISTNRDEDIGSNVTLSIGANRDEAIGATETVQIGADKHHTVDADYKELTTGNKESTITGDMIKYISGNYEEFVAGDYTLTVEGNMYRSIDGTDEKYVVDAIKHWTDETANHYAAVDYIIHAEQICSIEGLDEIILRADGDASLEGADVYVFGGTVSIGEDVYCGPIFNAGPTVNLGVGCSSAPAVPLVTDDPDYVDVSEPAAPSTPASPAAPISAEAPPAPHIPPVFPFIDVPKVMPEPGCP